MKQVTVNDTTLALHKANLSFRKKIEIAGILDKMKLSVISMGEITESTEDRLLIKTVASTVQDSILAFSVGLHPERIASCMEGLTDVKHLRLQVKASLSTARMEYVYHKKQNDMLSAITQTVAECKAVCNDVEFCADDATRAEFDYLKSALSTALAAGATTVTVCDSAGAVLPNECGEFFARLQREVPALSAVNLGVMCSNTLGLADACTVAALQNGVSEVSLSVCHNQAASFSNLIKILQTKEDAFPFTLCLATENFAQPIKAITNLCNLSADSKTPFEDGVRKIPDGIYFTQNDTEETITKEIQKLGYLLSDADREKVYDAFRRIVAKKSRIDLHELEVIVASEALQAPQAYRLESFVVTTGNRTDSLAHIKLRRKDEILDGISLGNGSVDASFLAIEKITGCHYELDDFQIQAITEGKEAMGQTIVKLRSRGKVYSGKGVSTDIVISAIEAYLNSLNKIVYEEERT